jgi:hypothetical protein
MLKMIKNFTPTQWLLLGISTAAFLNASAAQLTEWFGPKVAHDIITAIGFTQGLVSAWAMALTGQSSAIDQVLAMPGVEKIDVNAKANSVLAAKAVDPKVNKIAPTPAAMDVVTETAKG